MRTNRLHSSNHPTAFSAVLFKNDVTDQPTSLFYGGKRSALFCCHGRIEIKYLFLWLLQNNLLGVEMLFEIQKPQLFCFKQHSYTPQSLFHNRHENTCFISLKHVTRPP